MKQNNNIKVHNAPLRSEVDSNINFKVKSTCGDDKKSSSQDTSSLTSNIKVNKINVGLTTNGKPRKRRPNLFYDNFIVLYKYDPSTNNDEFYALIENEDDLQTYLGVSKRSFSASLCHILSGHQKLLISKNGVRVVPYVYSKLDDEE